MCIHACIGTYICIDIRMDVRVWMYVYTCVSYSIFYLLIVSVLWNLILWNSGWWFDRSGIYGTKFLDTDCDLGSFAPCKRSVTLRSDTPFTWSKNDVDRDLYHSLDCDLDCNPGPDLMKTLESDLSLKMTFWTQPDVVRLKWCFIKRLKSK